MCAVGLPPVTRRRGIAVDKTNEIFMNLNALELKRYLSAEQCVLVAVSCYSLLNGSRLYAGHGIQP